MSTGFTASVIFSFLSWEVGGLLYYLSSSECLKQLIKISELQSCLAPGEFSAWNTLQAFLLTRTLSILQGWIQSRLPIVPAESDLPLLHPGHSASPRPPGAGEPCSGWALSTSTRSPNQRRAGGRQSPAFSSWLLCTPMAAPSTSPAQNWDPQNAGLVTRKGRAGPGVQVLK